MKRATKSRWNPAATFANVIDLYGRVDAGGLIHNFDAGIEFSREINRNASYNVVTTSGSVCPAPLIGFDCTRLHDPDPSDPWAGTITRGAEIHANTNTLGLYAFDSVRLGERWVLNLGLRHDSYDVDGTVLPRGATVPLAEKGSWAFVNYQLGLVFKPTEDASVYASWSTSSTPPTVSGGDQNAAGGSGSGALSGELLDPEETGSFEIGAKANLFGDRLAVSAAAFVLRRENAAIQVSPGVFAQAGEAEVKGLELGVSGNLTRAWQVFGGYTWMDSKLVSGAFDSVNVGDPLANTPAHAFSLFSTYRVTPTLNVGGGVYHVSDSFGGKQGGAGGGANRIYAPAWTRIDLFAAWDVTETATLQLNVQNAGDEEYVVRTNGVHHADLAPARQAILTLNLRY
jgi:catecholate siderophore receptor